MFSVDQEVIIIILLKFLHVPIQCAGFYQKLLTYEGITLELQGLYRINLNYNLTLVKDMIRDFTKGLNGRSVYYPRVYHKSNKRDFKLKKHRF